MQKTCKKCGKQFEIDSQDQEYYKKNDVPLPTHCPDCRMQIKMAFRNERNLYSRKCDLTGKKILSIYPPTSPYKVYDRKEWYGDNWDPLEYGKDFDFSRSFFEQFKELSLDVPQPNLKLRNNENSEHCHDTSSAKNCYLCFNADQCEDSYYCNTYGLGSKNCVDMFWCLQDEICYECTKTHGSYHSFWCLNCEGLVDCILCTDCKSCQNCFGCIGLRHKKYCLYNKQLGKEKYEEFINNFDFSYTEIERAKKNLYELILKTPQQNLHITASEDCIGDYIQNSKNCTDCFDVMDSENSKYVWDGIVINSYDCFNTGLNTNFAYECSAVYNATNVKFSTRCSGCSDIFYSDFCIECDHLFGCIGLKHKKYCILNKQYSKEEYEILVPKIIEHMRHIEEFGEFFPPELSPSGYNDTIATEYFPLKKEDAKKLGFNWNDYKNPEPKGIKIIPAKDLPEKISDTPEEISSWVIECDRCKKPYKIIKEEFEFYKKQNIPVPRLCPDCRHYARKAQINPRKLFTRKCGKCGTEMETTFAPDRPEIVYCEKCYLETVY